MAAAPVFVVFEGLDGSGTSTQAQKLADWLATTRTGKSRLTSEPSGGPVGQLIRTALSGRLRLTDNHHLFDRQLAFLFAADRHDHLYNDTDGVQKLLREGFSVVSTRYYASSFAYHCSSLEDTELIRKLNADFPEPDLMIYLDVPVDVSLKRLGNRSNLDTYENGQKLEQAKRNYDNFFRSYSGNFCRISGTLPSDEVHALVREAVGILTSKFEQPEQA